MYSNDWQSLGDVQYRKIDLFELEWDGQAEDCRLDQHILAVSKSGGPVAMIRDESKLVKVTSSKLGSQIRVFTSAGRKLSESPAKDEADVATGGRLVCMGWTDQELLVTVRERGGVAVYDIRGACVRQAALLGDLQESIRKKTTPPWIAEAQVWGDGVVAITSDLQVCVLSKIHTATPRVWTLPTGLGRERPITAMAVLEPAFTESQQPEFVLATADGNVAVVGERTVRDNLLAEPLKDPVVSMAVAPDGRFLCCFTRAGLLAVMSANFATKVLEFDTSTSQKPQQMVWCGQDSVLLHWRGTGVLMVGPYGDWQRYQYPSSETVFLAPEMDCCRILTQHRCELLQRVPPQTEAINRIGSTDPAAMLCDAMEAFEDGDPKADENIRAMEKETGESGSQLVDAVQACIAAASTEFDKERQKFLLKAASYGKGFLQEFDSDEFVDCCRKLRVLNSLRDPAVGMPLTSQQYDAMTPTALVDRLVTRGLYFLALKVCDYLRLKTDQVVVQWACQKIASSKASQLSDEALRDLVRAKLEPSRQTSYTEVARAADTAGRRRLATMLLDLEPLASDQVPMLLAMGEEELALQKALASADLDLVYMALLHAEQSAGGSSGGDREAFHRTLGAYPEACNLLKAYYRNRGGFLDRRNLHNLCVSRGQFLEAATLAVQQAYTQEKLSDRLEGLKAAEKIFAQSRDLGFQQACTREQQDLLEVQADLEARAGLPVFSGMSVSDTLYHVISVAATQPAAAATPLMQEAAKLQKRFKVPDKRFWYLKIKALAATGQWDQLRRFADHKKSPIGYKPFAMACIKHQQPPEEAERYIDKIPQLEDRYELYLEIRSFDKALDVAQRLKDPRRVTEVRRLFGGGAPGPPAGPSLAQALR